VTYRLAESIPKAVLIKLQQGKEESERKLKRINNKIHREQLLKEFQQKYFKKFEQSLDAVLSGPVWLRNDQIAQINVEGMHKRDIFEYELYAYTIMPNHIHLVFHISDQHIKTSTRKSPYPVTSILQYLKRETAIKSNIVLNRRGQFWERESYDHIVRNKNELVRVIKYTLNNPVKAGFVERPEDWRWNYCKKELRMW
jgi:putative transposase